jgi:hypothetical protein
MRGIIGLFAMSRAAADQSQQAANVVHVEPRFRSAKTPCAECNTMNITLGAAKIQESPIQANASSQTSGVT